MSDSTEYVTVRMTKEQAKRFVNATVPSSRPKGWSRKSYSSYYNESYAGMMKDALDKMMVDHQDVEYLYENWSNISENSLYLRVNHSLRYLKDFMDPEFKYASWLEKCAVYRKKRGIIISLRPEFAPKIVIKPSPTPVIQPTRKNWQRELELFIDNSKAGDKFCQEDLALTRDEVLAIKKKFAGLDQFAFNITHTTIKVINT